MMIAPERWHEYEKKYQRYGFDMEPAPRTPRKERRTGARKRVLVNVPFASGKKMTVLLLLAVSAVLIMSIIFSAYATKIRFDINAMIKENNALSGEIETLKVKIYSANNVNYIEGRATGKLGMVYPGSKRSVYISMDDLPERGFAGLLKEKAYN